VNPRLVDSSGKETKLTSMKWNSSSSGFGSVKINQNANGGAMKVDGKSVEGIGTHADSLISYKLPKNNQFTRFLAKGALDDGGVNQGACGNQASVQFQVFAQKPIFAGASVSGPKGPVVESAIKVIPPMRSKTSMFMKKLKPPFSRANP
jgi:hypothetical protein